MSELPIIGRDVHVSSLDWISKPSLYPVAENLSSGDIREAVTRMRQDILLADKLWLPRSPKLFPFQKLTLRAYREHNVAFTQQIRGTAKSWGCARYILDESLCTPLKTVFTAPTFRQAKHCFNYVETFIEPHLDPKLPLSLKYELDGTPTQGNERCDVRFVNGSHITALPMGDGEKIRGERADILVIDEFFKMEREMFKSHILPFLLGHRDDVFGVNIKKLIMLTSAEYADSFAYSFFVTRILPELNLEDAKREIDPTYRRKYIVLDVNVDDVREDGYHLDEEILKLMVDSSNENERQQKLYNKWVGTSGQFLPTNIWDKLASVECKIEHEAQPKAKYGMVVDVARAANGDFFVIHVFRFFEDGTCWFVNTYWDKGLSLSEMAWKIHCFNRKFNPDYIILDKGGGGIFLIDELMKHTLEFIDGTVQKIAPDDYILLHDEHRNMPGQHKLLLNKFSNPIIREGLVNQVSKGVSNINSEDVLIHFMYDGLKQKLSLDTPPFKVPFTYSNFTGEFWTESKIHAHMVEAIKQLRFLAISMKEAPDGTKEVQRTKGSKMPKYIWHTANKDGAVTFCYGYLMYCVMTKDLKFEVNAGLPTVVPHGSALENQFSGIREEYSQGQRYNPFAPK